MKYLGLLFFSASLLAADPTFNAFLKNPNDEKTLAIFKSYCDKNSIDYDGSGDGSPIIQESSETGNINLIRAMIYSIPTRDSRRCSDGASAGSVREALGTDILLNYPSALIQALYLENRPDLANLVGESDIRWVDCEDKKCKTKKKAYFAKKRSVLLNVKLKEKFKPLRAELLKELKNL